MAIIPNLETTRKLTSQDIYDIIHFSAQSAEDNGFVNQYVFERALYAYAAIILYPDRKEEIGRMVSNNILDAWDALVSDGTTSEMEKNFSSDIKILGDAGSVWLDDYIKYLQSARGILSSFQEFSGDIIQSYRKRFARCANDPTCILTENKCNKCGSKCRMSRDPTETKIFVCTKCRNVQL